MSSWKGKSRGTVLGHKVFVFLLRTFGLGPAFVLLRFVAFYFLLFAPKATLGIIKYHKTAHRHSTLKALVFTYKTIVVFGKCILDKVYVGMGNREKYTFEPVGFDKIESLTQTGGIVVSAHIGNWDITGFLMEERYSAPINILMFEAEEEKIREYIDQNIDPKKVKIIPVKSDMSHLIKVNAALKRKELVCMHGDRFVEGSRSIAHPFFNQSALFPAGVFNMAAKLEVPVCFAFAMREANYQYKFYACGVYNPPSSANELLDEFVTEMEKYLTMYPTQWFNFYNFWSKKVQGAKLS